VNYVLGRQPMRQSVTAYDDDVWIVSYPRSGNTWTRFLIANLTANGRAVDWKNIERLVPDIYINRDPDLRKLPRPRYLKSHEPYRPEYRRVLLIVRDPRDVVVSYYHFSRKRKEATADGGIEAFVDTFLAGRVDDYGNWGENVGSWLGARRGTANFSMFRYEDLIQDPEREVAKIAEALELNIDAALVRHAVENSDADNMRRLESSQHQEHKLLRRTRSDIPFVRAGKSGQWESELSREAAERIKHAWGNAMRELGYL
jgi:hypothetical protein